MRRLVRANQEPDFELHSQIVQFFLDNPSASDAQVHTWANSLGVEPEVMEAAIYKLLSSLLRIIGKHSHVPDVTFDPVQLDQGIKVEMEHTDIPFIAKMIAKDHLIECPEYYTFLAQAESDCKREEKQDVPAVITVASVLKNIEEAMDYVPPVPVEQVVKAPVSQGADPAIQALIRKVASKADGKNRGGAPSALFNLGNGSSLMLDGKVGWEIRHNSEVVGKGGSYTELLKTLRNTPNPTAKQIRAIIFNFPSE